MNWPQLPITLWPEGRLPEPAVHVASSVSFDGALFRYSGTLTNTPLAHPEVAFRELQGLDPRSGAAVREFVAEFGVLVGPAASVEPIQLRNVALMLGFPCDVDEVELGPRSLTVPAWRTAALLALCRCVADHLSRALRGSPVESAWSAYVITDESTAWRFAADALSVGLRECAPTVRVVPPKQWPKGFGSRLGVDFDPESPRHRGDLYSALCVQMFNTISEQPTVRFCANQTCGRLFFKQVGGAQHGQYRTGGLRFCSPSCARAETQREYRRRKADKGHL